jgi:hypothetical protein
MGLIVAMSLFVHDCEVENKMLPETTRLGDTTGIIEC